jgi:hypothetical protein
MSELRKIKNIIEPKFVMEGAGVRLRRSISPHSSNLFDPFLLFDHFAFNDPTEGENPGFPMHPHRGIETVTYILEGSVKHRDSLGNQGVIGPGDVQWMTSGRGILHEEMPRRGQKGEINGFQLWVNLPASQKMSTPRYQEVNSTTIPVIEHDRAKIRVVAGEVYGRSGPVTEIAAKPVYIDVDVAPGAEFRQIVPIGHSVIAYVFEGNGSFGTDESVTSVKMVQFEDGDHIIARASNDSNFRFMLIAGAPFKEPIVPYGPFVMNTVEEIQQTLNDLRNGTFVTV